LYPKIENMHDLKKLFDKKLGFGSLRLPYFRGRISDIDVEQCKKMVDIFLENGFRYFETAYTYQDGKNERAFKRFLTSRYPRDKYLIAGKLPIHNVHTKSQCFDFFSKSLSNCGVDFFDFYLLHNVGYETYKRIEMLGVFDFLYSLKQKNLAKHVGFSFHDTAEVLNDILLKHYKNIDFIQLQLNYLDWESPIIQSRKCYEIGRQFKIPIFVMEPVKGGHLAEIPSKCADKFIRKNPEVSIASWAIRYVASLEGVVMVLSGMSNIEQLEDNVSYMKDFTPLSPSEIEVINDVAAILKNNSDIQCVSCGYCEPTCPKNIPIPKLLSLYNSQQIAGRYYERLCYEKGKASECIDCGKCESLCPQKIDIRLYLSKLADRFETPLFKRILIKIKTELIILLKTIRIYNFIGTVYWKVRKVLVSIF